MRDLKHTLILLASVLIIACEQDELLLSTDSSLRSSTITLTAQPPEEEEEITLFFTTFTNEAFPQGPTDSDTLIHVTTIPAPGSLWQGHVVALVEPIEPSTKSFQATVLAVASVSSSRAPEASLASFQATVPEASASGPYKEARIVLLSKSEWSNLPSALNITNPQVPLLIPATYCEGTLKDWRIPTAAEAKALKNTYTPSQSSGHILGGRAFESLNALLTSVAAPSLQATDEKGAPIRYLCEDATRTFSFAPGTTISAAGTKATNYHLRLIKTIHLKHQSATDTIKN